ncbi:MAG TPA: hypothetical protein VGP36_23815 [Mycobacteriales bacterium]|jgi:hypothetical protein|nr:hypothetical protein [Mycobacteriales bacterium]
MLNLFSKFIVPGVDHVEIFQDDEDALQFWMLPGKPSLVTAADGLPAISLMTFARDLSLMADSSSALPSGETEGGVLNMSLELSVSQDDQAKILDYIRSDILGGRRSMIMPMMRAGGVVSFARRAAVAGTPKLSYPTWVDGTVKFTVLPASGLTFVKGIEGSDHPSLTSTNIVSYTALLGQEGVRLLKSSAEDGVFPGVINYALTYQVRIPNIHISITGEASDIYDELKDHVTIQETQGGRLVRSYPQVSSLKELQTKIVSLHIEYDKNNFPAMPGQDQHAVDDANKALEDLVLDIAQGYLKDHFFTPAFSPDIDKKLGTDPLQNFKPAGAPVTGGNQLWLKDFEQHMDGHLEFTLDGRISQPMPTYPNALLYEVVTPEVMAKRITTADLNTPIFHVLDVPVRVTADFEKDPIAAITVTLDYKETDERTGDVIAHSSTFTYETGDEVFYFRTTLAKNADGSPKDTYRYSSRLNYKASTQAVTTPVVDSRERSLIIGYDGLSCVQVDCIVGGVPWDVVDRVDVRFRYPGLNAPSATERISLAANDTANKRWFTYTGGNPSREYEYQVSYGLTGGHTISLDPVRDTTSRLTIDGPFTEQLDLSFTSQGVFPPISVINLSTRYTDEAHGYGVTETHAFTAAAQTWEWTVPLLDKGLREYEYRFDVTYADGSTKQGSWLRTAETSINIGDVTSKMMAVDVVPTLLDMTKWKLVLVGLSYTDAASGQKQAKNLQFTPAGNTTDPVTWTVALHDENATVYTYTVQGFAVDGSKKTVGPVETSANPLVIEL